VGDAVNIAARIEGECKAVGFDIVLSNETAVRLDGFALLDAGSMPLRGRRDRTHLHAVVGGREIAANDAFHSLQSVHHDLVAALETRKTTVRKLVASAKKTAALLPVDLTEFYSRIARRVDDFHGPKVRRTTSSGQELNLPDRPPQPEPSP
jgi:adenylate cyclase